MNRTPFPAGSVDETVYLCIRNYPTLFENRTQVLVYIFAGLGTGWHWHNGRLMDVYGSIAVDQTDEESINGDYKFPDDFDTLNADRQDFHRRMAAMDAESNARALARRANAEELTKTTGDFHCRGRYKETPIFNPPTDAETDWLAARDEVLPLLKAAWKRGDHKPKKPDAATRALAASVLAAIAERSKA